MTLTHSPQVLPLLAQAQDACVAMEHRVVARLRSIQTALQACIPRLQFLSVLNRETAAALETEKAPAAAAQRRAVASVADVLAHRLKVLCEDGGDTEGMTPSLAEHARAELQAQLQALGCMPADSSDGTLPPPSCSDPPGTMLTPEAARALLAAQAAAAAAAAAPPPGGAVGKDVDAVAMEEDGARPGKRPVDEDLAGQEHKRPRAEDAAGDVGDHMPAEMSPVGAPAAMQEPDAAAMAALMDSQRSMLGSVSPERGGIVGEDTAAAVGAQAPGQPQVAATPAAGLLAAHPGSGGHSSQGIGSGAGAGAGGAPASGFPARVPVDAMRDTTPHLYTLIPPTVAPGLMTTAAGGGCGPLSGSPSYGGQRILTYSSADPVPPPPPPPPCFADGDAQHAPAALEDDEELRAALAIAAALEEEEPEEEPPVDPDDEAPGAEGDLDGAGPVDAAGAGLEDAMGAAFGDEGEDDEGKEDTPPDPCSTQVVGGAGGTQLLHLGCDSQPGGGSQRLASQSREIAAS